MTELRWGLLAAGTIAAHFAAGVDESKHGVLGAVAARDAGRARDFATRFDIPKAYGSYEDLLADPDVDAVYVSTPHALHKQWAIAAAEAGMTRAATIFVGRVLAATDFPDSFLYSSARDRANQPESL